MKQADLQKMYQQFRGFFCEEMPESLPIKITRAKNYSACAMYDDNGLDMEIYFGKPGMEIAFKTGATWEAIMLHEMCHLWERIVSPNSIRYKNGYGGHSSVFRNKLKKVYKASGIGGWWDFADPFED